MVLEAGSNPIETHPSEFDTMLKTVMYPKNYDSVSGWISDVGDGEVLKEPVRTVANDADLARIRVVARNTLERVSRGVNHGFEKRALQYNNVVENNRWGKYVNWKLYPLFGLLEHRKVSIGLPYKIHLQREINDNKIFFGENNSDAKLEITNIQLYIPVITPSVEVETRIFNSLTKDIEIAFLRRNTIIDKYKHWKVRDDIDLERIDQNLTKKGGFLPFLPLIFAGLAAAEATAGGAAGIAKAVNDKEAEAAANAEARRHNLAMERKARGGSGVGDILGTVKEFGQRFGEETKKTVKEGLSKLINYIDT
ncbi:hypothetical protein LOTGIDRAFT_174511 [Lottia gigantea]|uniref:Uncharacterized protein n=1 Tax=Lottia gigantea TaxID=225164 RepID=V4A093_LOTGI|nr:hypothetical protein LOTGIDRAFT_174511 [Lottia gigantea]ESO97228.1 hypothetical protein LOTGIDRAFT_174511 [Lottia gigantea]